MNIDNAATVLAQAATSLSAYHEGKMFEHNLVLQLCFDKLNPALDCVWQIAITSPMYQRMPDWVPLESKVKTALCVLKAIQHQITNKIFEFNELGKPGYLEALETTARIFQDIARSIKESGSNDYPKLDYGERNQLIAALLAAINLLEATKPLLAHKE